ncbi:polysaccharide deacetylase [Sulfurifustis variabilis]|uniref:Polysaccharide deacetylase n=1 Tax=Sulfurifustis variabilis TaxID=1675686 RepID=A0A1B4V2Y2_9GAMM|nr:polysaccharide deacetylase family protein [Sulfurifustis variabilis]BAU47919.1 polysaccharide deacetylase [Sulfurifustis variabilis]
MRGTLRRVVPRLLLPATAVYQRWRPGIRILMYHRVVRGLPQDQLTVSPERFEEQMAVLARTRRVMSLADAALALGSGERQAGAVVVTFDDGYRDNLTVALPILEKYRIPATIFVTTDFCDQVSSHPRYGERAAGLHLNWDEVRELLRSPLISIGSHTVSHPYLQRLDPEAARREIGESRRRIEARIGRPVEFFCYPSGDFGEREMRYVQEAGYRAAVSVAPGLNRRATPRYALRRTEVTDRDGARELRAKLHGAFDPLHALLHARRRREFDARRLGVPNGEIAS